MAKIRVTRFSRNTRYAVLVPNDQTFDCTVIKRVTRLPPKKGHPHGLRNELYLSSDLA